MIRIYNFVFFCNSVGRIALKPQEHLKIHRCMTECECVEFSSFAAVAPCRANTDSIKGENALSTWRWSQCVIWH